MSTLRRNYLFQSRIKALYSLLDCILQIQNDEWFNFLEEMELLPVQCTFIGNFCHGEKYFVPLGVERALVIFESSYSKSGVIRPNIELDDISSFISLAESMSLTHTVRLLLENLGWRKLHS